MKFVVKAVVMMLAGALALGAQPGFAGEDSLRPALKINRDKGDQCVEPTEVMRKEHMEFLLHQRDETMYRGIRTTKHSLKECVDCHANKDEKGNYIPVNAPGEFCQTCHAYSSVTMDCFQCHATKPRKPATHSVVIPRQEVEIGGGPSRPLAGGALAAHTWTGASP